jgi:flagellar basal-body rod modification protein FlgD
MATNPILAIGTATTPSAGSLLPIPTKTLSQDDFLKLLVVQMKAQDPLNPKTDTEFISQMTQFSALEQSKSMQRDIAGLRGDQELLQADAMIGRYVTLHDGNALVAPGVVSAVDVMDGTPKIVVNGIQYSMSQVLSISTVPQER